MSEVNNRLVIILGMHRSGTSAITRTLPVMGVELGDRLIPSIEGNNAKGFWEDIDLNDFDNEILEALGSQWSNLSVLTPFDLATLRSQGYFLRAVELLRKKVGASRHFGFKDPRMAKLLPFWREVFAHCQFDVSYILAVRHPLSVARSLNKRDSLEPEQSYLLWLGHVLPSLVNSAGNRRLVVDYDRLMQSPDQQLQRIANSLGLEIDGAALQTYKEDFLDEELRHTVYTQDDLLLDPACPPLAHEVYAGLLELAGDHGSLDEPAWTERVGRWSAEYTRLAASLRLADKLIKRNEMVGKQLHERGMLVDSLHEAAAAHAGQLSQVEAIVVERDSALVALHHKVGDRDRRVEELQLMLSQRDMQVAALDQGTIARDAQITELHLKVGERDRRVEELQSVLSQREIQVTGLNHQITQRDGELAELLQQQAEVLDQIAQLQLKLEQQEEANAAMAQAIAECEEGSKALQRQIADADAEIARLSGRLAESDSRIDGMRGEQAIETAHASALHEHRTQDLLAKLGAYEAQILDLHRVVGARDGEIAGLKHDVRTQAEQLTNIEQSKSWRLTKPLRAARRNLSIASSPVLRGVLSDSARQAWRHLPMSVSNKQKLKSAIFRGLPFLFRHTLAYRSWANGQRCDTRATSPALLAPQRPNVLEPVTYVPLLQAKPLPQRQAKLICFYLPQFHTFPENDAWWGKGFTEWTNVVPAQPHFEGHYQPHVSGELGNYNLLDPAVQRRQVELAKLYGIEGFCFYFYWFAGHRLMEQPIRNFMEDSEIDLPFCLCWANENWSRRWDGLDSEILIAQEHSPEDDLAFIAHMADYLQSPRYIRVDGKPLLLVYRPSLLPSAAQTAQRWRDWCRENGIGEIYLAYTQSFEVEDPAKYGFDAAIEFPPNNSAPPNITDTVVPLREDFAATVYDWRVFVERSEQYKQPNYKLYRSVCPAWDNTARRKNRGTIFQNSSPKLYQRWLENAINYTAQQSPDPDQRLIFVNAWNEWAEGAHLEPDQRYGYAYLQATRDALSATSNQQLGSLLLVTHDCHPHGAQFLILETAKELRDCGFKVYILALGGGRLLDDFIAVGDTLCAEAAGPEATAAFLQAVSSAGATHAITSTVVSGSVVPQLKQLGFKVLSLIHELPGVIRDMHQENNAALIAAHADKVVFPADLVHQKFTEIAAVDSARALVRHQGVVRKNPYKHRRDEAHRMVCAKHKLAADTQIVLSIAYMDRRKGPDLFVEMAAQVLTQRPNTAFIWIGHADRELEHEVQQRIAALGLGDKIILVGFERDPLMYYAAASVYALTSREDPFPNVVLESAEAGAPVVAFSGTSGASDFIVAHQGLLAAHLDTADFARKVCQLLATPPSVTACDVSLRRYALDLVHHLNGMPRVSVVVPNYKYERYIGQRLDSIFQQTYPVYEVIVLDDASPDGSVAAIKDYLAGHSREARLIVNDANSGSVFRQWKKGVDSCAGDLVWIAEADDLSETGFLQELATAFADPQLMLAYCQSKQMDVAGNILADSYLEYTLSTSDCCLTDYFRDGKEEIVKAMCIKNTIPNVSAVLMRRSALQQTLDGLTQQLYGMKVAGDWLVYLHIMMQGKVCHSKKPLNLHRRHDSSVTGALAVARHIDEIIAMQQEAMRLVPPSPAAVAQAQDYIDQVCDHFKVARRHGVHREAADVA